MELPDQVTRAKKITPWTNQNYRERREERENMSQQVLSIWAVNLDGFWLVAK